MRADEKRGLGGVLPVFHTPFQEDESIDYEILNREIDFAMDSGASGVVMAMASETLRLSSEERDELAAQVCRFAHGRGVSIISVGAESAHTAARHARHAESVGADALMAIPPVSVGVGEDALASYYRRILDAVSIPVILQDASAYVGQPMSIAFQARLLEEYGPVRVQYKPEAQPIGSRLTALRDATGGRARMFEGLGGAALIDSHARGVVGTMPGVDVVKALVALWNALEAGDADTANRIHGPLCALITLLPTLDAFIAVEKYLLVRQGILKNDIMRGPTCFTLDAETRREVDRVFDLIMEAVP